MINIFSNVHTVVAPVASLPTGPTIEMVSMSPSSKRYTVRISSTLTHDLSSRVVRMELRAVGADHFRLYLDHFNESALAGSVTVRDKTLAGAYTTEGDTLSTVTSANASLSFYVIGGYSVRARGGVGNGTAAGGARGIDGSGASGSSPIQWMRTGSPVAFDFSTFLKCMLGHTLHSLLTFSPPRLPHPQIAGEKHWSDLITDMRA